MRENKVNKETQSKKLTRQSGERRIISQKKEEKWQQTTATKAFNKHDSFKI